MSQSSPARDDRGARAHPVFAWVFDKRSRLQERNGMAEHRRDLLAHARGTVVEIGAGTGLNLPHYPPAVTEVVATEPEPNMRRRLERAASEAPVPVRILDAPAERLPLPDASVDTVVSTGVLCSVHDPQAALAEARRVLRPTGRLLVHEHVRAPEGTRLERRQDRWERAWGWFAGGCHPNRDSMAAVAAAGFVVEREKRFDFGPELVKPHVMAVARPAA